MWTVRPPRAVQEVQAKVKAAEAQLSQTLGRAPRASEVAVHLDVSLMLVRDALSAVGCFTPVSLDVAVAFGDVASAEHLGHDDPAFASAEARLALEPLMGGLGARDRRIIELRYFENLTQAQIGEQVGVSQEQVSRLLSGILLKMRRTLAA